MCGSAGAVNFQIEQCHVFYQGLPGATSAQLAAYNPCARAFPVPRTQFFPSDFALVRSNCVAGALYPKPWTHARIMPPLRQHSVPE